MSSVFKIYSPEDCEFYYDGELQGHIEGNSDRAFRFEVERKGAYRLKFVNSEYKSVLIVKVSIDADEEREVELDFSEVNEPVIQRLIIAIEHDYGTGEGLPEEIISVISDNGFITIPKGVRKIGNGAFFACSNLTSITIPNSVTEIGAWAFSDCRSLTAFYGKYASNDNRCLIKDGILLAFAPCGITKYTILNSVTEIGAWAFSNCSNLTSITIPNSVTKIEDLAFFGCSSLTAFYGKYASNDNRCLIKDGILFAFAPCDITKYTILNSVTEIGHHVFSYCRSLTSITIPNSVTKIEGWAFDGCKSLTSVTIPDSVIKIGYAAFSYCSSLTSVYCKATTPQKLGRDSFYNNKSDRKIYVPKSEDSTVLKAYKSAEGWNTYADSIEEYDFDNE